jgi:hypothetical protein
MSASVPYYTRIPLARMQREQIAGAQERGSGIAYLRGCLRHRGALERSGDFRTGWAPLFPEKIKALSGVPKMEGSAPN